MVATSALVGLAAVGHARVGTLGPRPPRSLRAGGGCWRRVTDPAIVEAAQDARDYADAQDRVVLDEAAILAQDRADAAQAEAVRLADIAATEALEAAEAALGEMVADKSNVLIQDVAPVESMQRPGVLWIDTTLVAVDGQQIPGNVPKTWDGTGWVALTDAAVVQAAREAAAAYQAAEDAATTAGRAMAEARYAPRIAQRPPTPADGADKPAGAGWLEYAETTNHAGLTADRLVQQWMWTGTTWVRLDMDPTIIPVIQIGTGTFGDLTGDRINVTGTLAARLAEIIELSVEHLTVTEGATISEAVAIAISGATLDYQEAYLHNLRVDGSAEIDEAVIGALASNIITSGLFRTAEEGQRLEIDSNGLIMWGIDPDGAEYEMVRLGPSGEQLLTIGSSTISEEAVAAPRGEFDELLIGGLGLQDYLSDGPRGIVAWGRLTANSTFDTTLTPVRRAELQATLQPDRLYRVKVSSRLLENSGNIPTYASDYVHTSYDAVPIFPANPGSSVIQRVVGRHYLPVGTFYAAPELEFIVDTAGFSGSRVFWAMYSLQNHNQSAPIRLVAGATNPMGMYIEDVGPSMPSTLKRWNDGGAVDPDPVVTRYTRTWSPQGWGGDLSGGDIVQGQYGAYGNRSGSWSMPGDMRTALQGSTIEKLEIYLYATHWYHGAGGTAQLRATDGSGWKAFVGSTITSAGWPRNSGRWVNIPTAWFPFFQSGTWKGFGVTTSSSSLTYYGRFRANATRFRATYRR